NVGVLSCLRPIAPHAEAIESTILKQDEIFMYRTTIWLLASCAWGVCLKWALLLQYLPASTFGQHTVCGPWGCGPPLPVLLACHTFWMVLLAPPAVVAAIR